MQRTSSPCLMCLEENTLGNEKGVRQLVFGVHRDRERRQLLQSTWPCSCRKSEVSNLLESAGFSRSNPYYVVQQGKVRG